MLQKNSRCILREMEATLNFFPPGIITVKYLLFDFSRFVYLCLCCVHFYKWEKTVKVKSHLCLDWKRLRTEVDHWTVELGAWRILILTQALPLQLQADLNFPGPDSSVLRQRDSTARWSLKAFLAPGTNAV